MKVSISFAWMRVISMSAGCPMSADRRNGTPCRAWAVTFSSLRCRIGIGFPPISPLGTSGTLGYSVPAAAAAAAGDTVPDGSSAGCWPRRSMKMNSSSRGAGGTAPDTNRQQATAVLTLTLEQTRLAINQQSRRLSGLSSRSSQRSITPSGSSMWLMTSYDSVASSLLLAVLAAAAAAAALLAVVVVLVLPALFAVPPLPGPNRLPGDDGAHADTDEADDA
uniref:Uncharacterized protein n=1 Tax=Anopheles farauti TaxID=69004 RepID=A0A182Q0Z4_9DIPT